MMSSGIDGSKLSHLIQSATQETVTRTEDFIKSVKGKPIDTDSITVMVNGVKTDLNRDDYAALKKLNNQAHSEMKANIKSLTKQFKESSKAESKNAKNSLVDNEESTILAGDDLAHGSH